MAGTRGTSREETVGRVSCIVPTHARDDELRNAVRSLQAQTVAPLEIIVCDDVPSRATERLVGLLALEAPVPVRYVAIRSQGRGTAGASRNRGAEIAKGDVLGFLDDDDTWEPAFLEECLGRLADPGTAMVVTWKRHVFPGGSSPAPRVRPALTVRRAYVGDCGVTGSNFLVRREAFDRVGGFDPDLPVLNDQDFLVRLLGSGATYDVVPLELLNQTVSGPGHLTSRSRRRAEGLRRYLDKHRATMPLRARIRTVRSVHSALRGADTPPLPRAYHVLCQFLYSSPSQLVRASARRVRWRVRYYE